MSVQIRDSGKNNVFEIPDQLLLHGTIECEGSNNRVRIGGGCQSRDFSIRLAGSNCSVEIGNACNLGATKIYSNSGASITIGDNAGFTWLTQIQCHEPSSIEIGRGFLCATETLITSSDMHSIFEVSTGKRINAASDIQIGDSVWLGQRSIILKGAKIGRQSVIGAHSVVSGTIPANVIAGGVPARVIKEGIYWKHELADHDKDWQPPDAQK